MKKKTLFKGNNCLHRQNDSREVLDSLMWNQRKIQYVLKVYMISTFLRRYCKCSLTFLQYDDIYFKVAILLTVLYTIILYFDSDESKKLKNVQNLRLLFVCLFFRCVLYGFIIRSVSTLAVISVFF